MKKMRKLIPALSMLMVAAIMLTTASFAWFTMNEQVTATGMQVQAQATGSLVISSNPLQASDSDPSVNFNTSVKQLSPIHLKVVGETVKEGHWMVPKSETGIPNVINPTLGTPDYRGMIKTTPSSETNYIEQTIYIGTSGTASLNGGSLEVALSSITSAAAEATKAYSVAVYVAGVAEATISGGKWTVSNANDLKVAVDAEPFMILHVDNEDNRNTATIALPKDVKIPSIVGYGENGDTRGTGLKVVLRFYVDGALETYGDTAEDKRTVAIGYNYTSVKGETYDAEVNYFVAAGYEKVTPEEMRNAPAGKVPAGWFTWVDAGEANKEVEASEVTAVAVGTPIDAETEYYQVKYIQGTAGMLEGETEIPEGWYTRTEVTATYNYFYVNNKDVPSAGSNLSVSFKHIPAADEE